MLPFPTCPGPWPQFPLVSACGKGRLVDSACWEGRTRGLHSVVASYGMGVTQLWS